MLLLEEWGTCLALGATLSLWLTARLCTSSCRFLLQIKHVLFNVCKEMKVLVETNLLSIKMWMGFFLIFRLIFHGSAVSSGWSTAHAACSSGLPRWAALLDLHSATASCLLVFQELNPSESSVHQELVDGMGLYGISWWRNLVWEAYETAQAAQAALSVSNADCLWAVQATAVCSIFKLRVFLCVWMHLHLGRKFILFDFFFPSNPLPSVIDW